MINNIELFPILRRESNNESIIRMIEYDLGIRSAFINNFDNLNKYWYLYSNETREDLPRIIILSTLFPYFDKYPTNEVEQKIRKLFK